MADYFTKSMARNIYYGGSFSFFLLLVGLTFGTVLDLPDRDHRENLTEAVILGKQVWENNDCIGCHSLMGEGAYYAPELANVFDRRGGADVAAFKGFLQGWMAAQPIQTSARRKMPQFNLSPEEIDALAEFLIWTSRINDNGWPPNIEG